MKQKYTITVAGVPMNVVAEESPETVQALVGMVDRKMKEIGTACPKTEAALLCALDYCSDKIKAQRKAKSLESRLSMAEDTVAELEGENEELRAEIQRLRAELGMN
jgi:cell division protein ZapA (FtsZ GTPase activity inhibitor)